MAENRLQPPPDSVVDWEAVDEEIKAVPSEYREPRFYPLKHVVEVFSSADPQGLTQELRDTSERLGAQLDAVVEGYHTGFARSIQNYSQILALFAESKEQVESMKHALADAAKQLGAHSRFMSSQWRKTVSLESSLRLLADIRTVVEVPGRVDAALAEKDWPRAVSCLLEGATLMAHVELRRVGALRKLRSDLVTLAGWIQDQMVDELTQRIYSGARASTSAPSGGEAGGAGAGGGGAGAGGGKSADLAAKLGALESARTRRAGGLLLLPQGKEAAAQPTWRRKGQEPAYKLVTDTLRSSRTASTELRSALSLGSAGALPPGPGPGPGPGGGAGLGGSGSATAPGSRSAAGPGKGGPGAGAGAGAGAAGAGAGGGGGGGGGDIAVDIEGAMRHVTTRELVACLAQVDGVGDAKSFVARQARLEMRKLIRRSIEAFLSQAASGLEARGLGLIAGELLVPAGGGGGGGGGAGGAAGGGGGSSLGASSASVSPVVRVLAQRLVTHVAGACLQALGRMQHVLAELAAAPATTQSSALDVLGSLRTAAAAGAAGPPAGDGSPLSRRAGRSPGGGGLTARERAAYLRDEYGRMWDALQEELQQLLGELLQAGAAAHRRPGGAVTRGGPGGVGAGAGGGGGGGGGRLVGGVRSLLSDLNPVHFLEQLSALAERTADFAENALGGNLSMPPAPNKPSPSKGNSGRGQGAAAGGPGPHAQQQQQQQHAAALAQRPQQQQQQQRRRNLNSKLTFGFDIMVPGLAGGDTTQVWGGLVLRGADGDGSGYGPLVSRALGERPGSVYLLAQVYLPAVRLVGRAEELLRLPPDLAAVGEGGKGGGGGGGAGTGGGVVVGSWLTHWLEEVALEQLLPQVWVELRGRCTAALEDAEAFRPQVGFSAAAAASLAERSAAADAAEAAASNLPSGPASSSPAAAAAAAASAASSPPPMAPRAVVPLARFLEVVLRELVGGAAALPPFTGAFLAMAERILDRMLGAFAHMVRLVSADCPSVRLVSRSDVCMAMAAETDALLLREPVAFAPQPYALPGSGPGPGVGGGVSATELVAFVVSLRTQERPMLVPASLRPLSAASGSGAGGHRGPVPGFGADGDAAEAELQYLAMRERPQPAERLLLGQGAPDRAIQLAALSESLDYVVEAVVRLSAAADGGGGGGGAQPGAGTGAGHQAAAGSRGLGKQRTRGRNQQQQEAAGGGGGGSVPDLLLPVVQSYKALSGHCSRLLRLEALMLVGAHLAPVAAASHLLEEEEGLELPASLGSLTRACLRASEELAPFLQPAKRAYVFGPLAATTARGMMWLLPAIHDINSLGVERMIRALTIMQPPLTSLIAIAPGSAAAAATAAAGGAGKGGTSGASSALAAAEAAAAAASAVTAWPPVSGQGPSAGVLAALLLHPEARAGERARLWDRARGYYELLLEALPKVVRAAGERPGRFAYAEWMALLQARVPGRTVTDVGLGALQRCLDRAYGLTPGARVAEVMGAVVGAVQAPAERLGDALLGGLAAGKDSVLEALVAGRDGLVAGVRVPAQTLQRVFRKIGAGAAAAARAGRGKPRPQAGEGHGAGEGQAVEPGQVQHTGSFLVVAGIGAYVRLTAKYGNHSFAINTPSGLQVEDSGAFEIMAPVYDVDIRDTQTRTLRVGLVGGLCRYALGKPRLQFTAYQCQDQSSQRPLYRRVDLDPTQPYTELVLPALAWEVQYVELNDEIPGLNTQAVFQYLLITNQISQFANLTADPDTGGQPPELTWEFMAPNDIEVDVCRNYKINAIQAVYSAFQPPDSALVGKDVVLLRRAARYKMRMRLFGQYGRLRCDNVSSSIFIQDSIGGEVRGNQCSVKNRGCNRQVSYQTRTNTSEYIYDLVPLAINFGALTAYSTPLSIVADSEGWPSRSFLLYSIVEGTEDRLGTGYIEVPIPVPLLILRDPPGDRSYATLESSISTAVKLSMVNNDRQTCGGMHEKEIFSKALPWLVDIIENPLSIFTQIKDMAVDGYNTVKNLFSSDGIKSALSSVGKGVSDIPFSQLKGGGKYASTVIGAALSGKANVRDPDPAGLSEGRGGALSWRAVKPVEELVKQVFSQAGAAADASTLFVAVAEMLEVDPDHTEEFLARLVKRFDDNGDQMAADPNLPDINLQSLAVAFNKDPYAMQPGNKFYQTDDKPDFELHPTGFSSLHPQCEKKVMALGYDIDVVSCAGLGAAVCTPMLKDRGSSGVITDKAWYNEEDEENFYKLTITREEGFSTPKQSTPELVGGDADMILAPTFAIMFTLQDRLQFDTKTCTPTATMGIPGWNLREDMHGTAWHSVWHIKNVVIPELQKRQSGELAKPVASQNPTVVNNLKEGINGWLNILKVYNDLTTVAQQREEELPSYQLEQQDVNGLTQGTIEGVWHTTLDDHPDRHMEAFEGRTIDWERLEKSPVWKQGYFEGAEKLQSLMLRTQQYMDASATKGNLALRPRQKAAVGGIVAGKQLDQLNRVYGTKFNTFSFSGGGGSYDYSLTAASTLSTKIGFSISFKNMFGFHGGGGGGTGFWVDETEENMYGFELEFNSQLLQDTERERTVTVHFEDKDVGDSFLVKIRPDTAFGTPMFELLAGRSKCPYEPGTLQREMARVSVLGGQNVQQNIKQGDSVVYELLLENRSGTDENVAMVLGPDLATNNANMQLQLLGAPWIEPVPAWPLTQPIIYNATDSLVMKNLTLILYNPNYAIQKWNTHPRLTVNTTIIQIEYVNTVNSGGLWTPVRYANGSAVNFAKIEDPSYGFAKYDWPAWQFLTTEGEYLLRFVVYCDILVGGGQDSRYEGTPISMLVDRTTPWPVYNSLTPYDMTYLPGDEIYVDFSEPLDCRQPFAFWWLGNQTDTATGLTVRAFSYQTNDFIAHCSGRRISFSWNPFNRPTPLTNGQNVSLQLGGVRDLAGNVQPRTVNITFVTGTLAPNAPIRLNFAMGPLPTTVRRLLFANDPGAAGSSLPHQLPHRLALRDYTEESFAAELTARLAARRHLLAELNAVLAECLGPWPLGPEAPGVVASGVVQDEDVSTMLVELQAFGIVEREEEDRVGTGESAGLGGPRKDAVWVAERLAAAAADNTSCLATRLKQAYAPLRGVFAHRTPEQQLLAGWSSEEVAVARRRVATEARAKGLPAAWFGAVRSLQAEAQAAAQALAEVAERALKSMRGEEEHVGTATEAISAAVVSAVTSTGDVEQEPYDEDEQHMVAAGGAAVTAAVTSDPSAAAPAPALASGSTQQEQQPQTAVSRRSMVTQQQRASADDDGAGSLWARITGVTGGRGVLLGLLLAGNLVALAAVAGIWRARRHQWGAALQHRRHRNAVGGYWGDGGCGGREQRRMHAAAVAAMADGMASPQMTASSDCMVERNA
ncbi:hypothetical protein HYH02_014272 [Chlamydomonas schloesseri]|uniref:Exocyst complex component Sec8 n=1 Tax=Chlamydomonas schloesseri TaxID=2026947 RepID=A0A835VXN5_9CHLO|nr:hypothetical protein HYH02_014272 [Chlamydomonas schloesseri]|eukprot:KAG2428861.1 hypothetical protein HYH02_014272 [Chlamydomonas schloesseri]